MTYIANPIFDAVFKYMMEDEAVAKRFIGILINKKIKSIKLKPQEKTYQKADADVTRLLIQRLDFIAEIVDEHKKKTKVLIEIQKSNRSYHADLLRFRGYLAQQYQSDDLPIITIYILGFELKDLPFAAVRAHPVCQDLFGEKNVNASSEFLEKLTHQTYVIQVPRLRPVLGTRLGELLDLFNQEYRLSDVKPGNRTLNLPYVPKDKDISLIVKRLERANADEQLREKLNDEEFAEMAYEEMFGKLDKKVLRLEKRLKKREKELEQEKQRAEQEKQRAEQEKQRAEQLEQEKIRTVQKLLQKGFSVEEVMEIAGVDEKFLKKHNLLS
ncbi:MAG: hypothetical protein NZ519_04155 [Bacteroidia bacterium]|nr:hypothetical protein [Bacteroidia bacterium]